MSPPFSEVLALAPESAVRAALPELVQYMLDTAPREGPCWCAHVAREAPAAHAGDCYRRRYLLRLLGVEVLG